MDCIALSLFTEFALGKGKLEQVTQKTNDITSCVKKYICFEIATLDVNKYVIKRKGSGWDFKLSKVIFRSQSFVQCIAVTEKAGKIRRKAICNMLPPSVLC